MDALQLGNHPEVYTLATATPLVKDHDGDEPNGVYNYASILAMLQYLQGHLRPDITYVVSQCAHFIHGT